MSECACVDVVIAAEEDDDEDDDEEDVLCSGFCVWSI